MSLADRAAITELIHRYCRAVDRRDIVLGRSIWHEDGEADYGDIYRGDGPGSIDFICAQHGQALGTWHSVGSIVLAVEGEAAASESYVNAAIRVAAGEGEKQIGVWGRYLDRWEKRVGVWGLVSRRFELDFDEIREVTPTTRNSRPKPG